MADTDPTSLAIPNRSHFYLVDGSGFIFRAFHALPPMSRADGTPTNAVFGFTNMLIKLIEDLRADHCAVIFDTSRKTFRSEIYDQYKAQRPPAPEELVPQFDIIRQAVKAFNVASVEMHGFEADDLIATYATLARAAGAEVTIVSSDKDLMQLVGPDVTMYDPMKNREIGGPEVMEKFGVAPDRVIDVQALAGDSVDNVPGVPGIGVKTAALLIAEYGDLDTLLARAGEIKQTKRRENLLEFAELARISRKLVTLKTDVEVPQPLEALAVRPPDPETVLEFLREQGFKRLITRYEAELLDSGVVAPMPPDEKPAEAVQYELVQDIAALDHWITEAEHRGVVAFDTETTSLDATQAVMIGLSMAIEPGRACYVPLRHGTSGQGSLLSEVAPAPVQIPFDAALARLKPLLENPGVLKIGHNIKYDTLVMQQPGNGGVRVTPVDDTMCLSYVMEGGMHGHGLDELSQLHFNHTNIKYGEVCGKGKAQIPFAEVPLERARDYAAEDADMTLRLHRRLKPELPKVGMATVYETLERPLIPVLAMMENNGIKVDPAILRAMSADFAKRLEEQAVEIHKLADSEFNIASPKQLGEILFDQMGLPGGKKGKTGAYGTGADILDGLAGQGHDLPVKVLEWRQLSKLKSTYTDALMGQIDARTGRVHTSYAQAITSTGRLSSNDPNLQNIPIRTEEGRKIRTAFVADEGNVLLSADYSQIELRLLAHVADIEVLKKAFKDGADIHAMTASDVFGIPIDELDSATRSRAKAINFGIIYGISPFGLARQLGIAQGDAKSYIEAYFERYPGVRGYMEDTKESARENGYVETIYGRRVHVPGIQDKNPARRNFMERAAVNAPLQGSAADIIKRAMILMPKALTSAKLKAQMLLQVHDELIFEVPESELEKTEAVVKKTMESAASLSVPLICDTGSGANWDVAH